MQGCSIKHAGLVHLDDEVGDAHLLADCRQPHHQLDGVHLHTSKKALKTLPFKNFLFTYPEWQLWMDSPISTL